MSLRPPKATRVAGLPVIANLLWRRQFLPLRELDAINRALVFDTPDCRVVGGVDIYTTKVHNLKSAGYSRVAAQANNLERSGQFRPLELIRSSTKTSATPSQAAMKRTSVSPNRFRRRTARATAPVAVVSTNPLPSTRLSILRLVPLTRSLPGAPLHT